MSFPVKIALSFQGPSVSERGRAYKGPAQRDAARERHRHAPQWLRTDALPGVQWIHYEGPSIWLPPSFAMLDYAVAHIEGPEYAVALGGTIQRTTNGVHFAEPGDIVLVRDRAEGVIRFCGIEINPALFQSIAATMGVGDVPLRSVDPRTPELIAAFCHLWSVVRARGVILQAAFRQLLRVAFDLAAELSTPSSEPLAGPGLRRAHDLILARTDGELTLDEIVAHSGLTKPYFVRAFHKAFGIPPHTYLMHVRFGRARRLLLAGCSPVEAAARVGFCDQSHMHRWFSKMAGCTPRAYSGQGAAKSQHNVPFAAFSGVLEGR